MLMVEVGKVKQEATSLFRKDHTICVELEFMKQTILSVLSKGIYNKTIKLRMNCRLSEPMWAKVYLFLEGGKIIDGFDPGGPVHKGHGGAVGLITHGLRAHFAFDIAVICEFEINVNAHFLQFRTNVGFMHQNIPRAFCAASGWLVKAHAFSDVV